MACKNCYSGCNGQITSAKCVKYVGEDIPSLGICTGDNIDSTLAVILEKIQDYAVGEGIDLSDINVSCDFLADKLGKKDQDLKALLQLSLDAECTLKELYDELKAKVDTNYIYDLSCVTVNVDNPTRDDILQAVIYKLCTVNSTVNTIAENYVPADQLNTLIAQYLDSISTGDNTGVQWNTRMVPYVAYPYHGPISNFDASGVGNESVGFKNVYICNGQNGTPDYRGRSPIGANQQVPGGSMSSVVDPTLPANSAYGISVGTVKGEFTHKLTLAENGPHTHSITDPGHYHLIANGDTTNSGGVLTSSNYLNRTNNQGSDTKYILNGTATTPSIGRTSTVKTGVTAGSSGSGNAHNTVHPVIGCYMIMFIPTA